MGERFKGYQNLQNILVIRTDRIGDVILSTPVVTALKSRFPQAKITMMVQPYTREIVQDHPDVDEVILDDFENQNSGLSGFIKLLRHIRSKKFDGVLVLHPTLRLALLVFLARIPVRVGTGYRLYSFLFNRRVFEHRKHAQRHELEFNLSLAHSLGAEVSHVEFKFPVSPEARMVAEKFLRDLRVEPNKKLVILHPGSGGSARNWSAANFAALSDRLIREREVNTLITGGPGEEKTVEEVLHRCQEKPFSCVGRLSLKELGALLQRADLVITNSTGPLHLAVAVGTEVISLFCPIIPCLPTRWGPYGQEDSVLMPKVPYCKKCIGIQCPYYDCMEMITVDQILNMVNKKLNPEGE